MKSFIAGKNDDGMRFSRFVERVTVQLSASIMYKSFRNGRMKINKKKAKPDARIHTGDLIELYLVDAYFPDNTEQTPSHEPERRPTVLQKDAYFQIVFENISLLLVHKPAGVLCHSDCTGDSSLIEAITCHLEQTGEYNPDSEHVFAPALCNRLDRGTEGLVIAAKTAAALRDINAMIRNGDIVKTYLCLASGRCEDGIYEAWHTRDTNAKTVTITARKTANAKPIKTGVTLLKYAGGIGLYKITLYTGRTHQIRAHMRFLGHPLLGDKKYGDPAANQHWPLKNQALCAYEIQFAQTDFPELAEYSGKTFQTPYCTLEKLFADLTTL